MSEPLFPPAPHWTKEDAEKARRDEKRNQDNASRESEGYDKRGNPKGGR